MQCAKFYCSATFKTHIQGISVMKLYVPSTYKNKVDIPVCYLSHRITEGYNFFNKETISTYRQNNWYLPIIKAMCWYLMSG